VQQKIQQSTNVRRRSISNPQINDQTLASNQLKASKKFRRECETVTEILSLCNGYIHYNIVRNAQKNPIKI
jgi:hypothetical protein